ncbi:GTPase ObgE [Stomatohabitans albus]|uniref:GTPase ObgE n=1 Tax=Stomatohabitans albus TaxID=3110766 RepID=UPI00300DB47F
MFVDNVLIHVKGGKGGDGVTSFRRQPYEPKGPPEGGDGGRGGNVIAKADARLNTLVDFHYRPHRRAGNGKNGSGDLRKGADGADEVMAVPIGTQIIDVETGDLLADLVVDGQEIIVAQGGRGGRGNAQFRTRTRRSPAFHEYGVPGDEFQVRLELKLVADVALIGFPNAGKSSLIRKLSAATPKVADYPFTTLTPNLGVADRYDVDFVVADVPGLIEGAADGKGLGHEFLRHVERAKVIVHVLDCASGYAATDEVGVYRYEQRIPTEDLDAIISELTTYEPALLERPAIIWLNKADADPDMAELVADELVAQGWEVLTGSAVTGEGVDALKSRLATLVQAVRAKEVADRAENLTEAVHEGPRPVVRPTRIIQPDPIEIQKVGLGGGQVGWMVHHKRFERWINQLDITNEDAVAYLQGRLKRAGLEDALIKAGATPGDEVQIADRVFFFHPDHWVGDSEDIDDGWDDAEEFGVEYVEYDVSDLPFSPVHEVTEDGKLSFYNDWFAQPGSPTFQHDHPDTDRPVA